jgi:DNA topoisomerase VI subunit B
MSMAERPPAEWVKTRLVRDERPSTGSVCFEQAKNPAERSRFLQNVAEHKLTRVAFRVSRLMEFCSIKELQNQTAHSVFEWPLVIAKEVADNGIDACEEAEVAPKITIVIDRNMIVVEDNADGIDPDTIASILDYTVRVSSREAYVSPTRGAQGNALKTILAMAYTIDQAFNGGDAVGVTIIESRGIRHRIEFRADHISNEPKIVHTTAPSAVAIGTRLTINWPQKSNLFETGKGQIIQLIDAYSWFNPHLSLRVISFGREVINVTATNPGWDKWRPRNPTSPHWYDEPGLQRYLAAHVARDRDLGQSRTVREFITEFRGLSGTAVQRRILDEVGCSHQSLADFFGVERVNHDGIAKLLRVMQKHSKPVKPQLLGVIGREHLKTRFLAAGGNGETFKYELRKGTDNGIPYVVEFAFGLHQTGLESSGSPADRKFVTGANWSAAISSVSRLRRSAWRAIGS